jgi:uncharacterized membrane protein YccF (DUF307 family)
MTLEETAPDAGSYAFGTRTKGVPFLLRVIWFILVGWWLGAIFIAAGYLFTGLLITIPLGWWFLNRIGRAMTLMPATTEVLTVSDSGGSEVLVREPRQVFWPLRVVYTFLIGLWIGAIWLMVAYILCVSIIFMPLGLWMINRAPTVLTLEQR